MADRTTKVTLTAQVSNYIAGMEKAAAATKATGSAAEKLAAQKEGFTQVGHALLAVGAVAAAGVGLAIVKFAEFDAKMSQVATLSHATAQEMESLRSAALNMGQAIGFSATEVADAEIELVKAGVSVKDIMGGALKGALELAAAGQIDVAQATEIATIALTQFKLKGSDVPHVADLLAAGADKALGGVSDLGEALKSGGLVAAQFGVSLEETVGTLSAFANAGLLGETAGTDLRQMLLKLSDPSKQAANDMKQYGISIYDTSGKFVGIANLAGQLHDKLGRLDEATRNQTLSTIFGARAIAGANVLYNEGAKGIQQWTNNVNDSGFAAQQARGKMDNLNGDIKKLGAAFQTDLIKTGAQANGVLRDVVQSVTGLVSAFGDLNGPAQGTVLALGAVVAGLALFGGGVLTVVPKIAAFKVALEGLGTSLKAVTLASGAVGLAVTAIVTALAIVGTNTAQSKAAIQSFTDTLDQNTGAMTKNTRAAVVKRLSDEGVYTAAKHAGISIKEVNAAVFDGGSALDSYNKKSAEFYSQAGLGTNVLRSFNGEAGALKDGVNNVRHDMQASIGVWKEQTQAAKDAGAATSDTASSMGDTAKQVDAVTTASDNASTALDDFAKALSNLGKVNLDEADANIAYQQSIADTSAALDKNGATLDLNTQAGRDNMSALDGQAAKAVALVAAHAQAGASTQDLTADMGAARQSFIDAAIKMGMNADAANNLADQYGLIPREVTTNAQLTGVDAAKQAADDLQASLDRIAHDWTIPVHIVTTGTIPAGARAVGNTVNANGGMYSYANGGFGAGIYSGGTPMYKFAEPETRWEAFISGKPGAEARNRQVWVDAGRRLGMDPSSGTGGGDRPIYMDGSLFGMLREMANGEARIVLNQNNAQAASRIGAGMQRGAS